MLIRDRPLKVGGLPASGVDRSAVKAGPVRVVRTSAGLCPDCINPARCVNDHLCWRAEKEQIALERQAKSKEEPVDTWTEAPEQTETVEPQPEANGAKPKRTRRQWDRSLVVAAFQAFHEKHGRWPASRDVDKRADGLPAFATLKTHVGTLAETIAAAQGATGAASEPTAPPPAPPAASITGSLERLIVLAAELDAARQEVERIEQQIRAAAKEIAG